MSALVADPDDLLRSTYERKKLSTGILTCSHVAGIMGSMQKSTQGAQGSRSSLPCEHHAVYDHLRGMVIHFNASVDGYAMVVREDTWEDFIGLWPTWRTVQLPYSCEHAEQILERALSKIGHTGYDLVSNNCEHFVRWCFENTALSNQVQRVGIASGVSLASGGGAGIAATLTAASLTTAVTSTSSVPYYFMGLIPWGTTTVSTVQTVPALSWATTAGIGGIAFAAATAVTAGASLGAYKWIDYGKRKVARRIPICLINHSDRTIHACLSNLDTAFSAPQIADVVHDVRARFGVGQVKLTLGCTLAGELNPAAEEEYFTCFRLCVSVEDGQESSVWTNSCHVASCTVKRGDVVIFNGDTLDYAPNPPDPFFDPPLFGQARAGHG